ncbi:conserved hypothetical protein [Ixodes scapularis]|uniref:CHY-type domain-containing protein n=1 Tax=Ixodes scapularis TaxID=6945 RepID=B7Q887_IXOSC|nr:conserved hypothetical protein [Ixodes scapularis]|eukprot:XP_002412318.1 conserved hypothetical protein [Ixodes scapularis]
MQLAEAAGLEFVPFEQLASKADDKPAKSTMGTDVLHTETEDARSVEPSVRDDLTQNVEAEERTEVDFNGVWRSPSKANPIEVGDDSVELEKTRDHKTEAEVGDRELSNKKALESHKETEFVEKRDGAAKSEQPDAQKPRADILVNQKRGTEVKFRRLELGENVATLECLKVALRIQCSRCRCNADLTTPSRRRNTPKVVKNVKDPAIQEGKPLPSNGICKHYKKSFRWLRFPCCGKAYPCDKCHDEQEGGHEMKFATRMICGHCAKEQPFAAEKPCIGCGSFTTKKPTAHWEGGRGCRDSIKMSRDDNKKYSGIGKTISRKAQDKNRAAVEKCEDGGIWGWLGSLATSMSGIPPSVQRLRSFHMDWHFAVGGEGKVLAILQDQSIEIRQPVAQMDGVLQDLSYAIAGMVFTEARVHKTQWSYELIAVNYRGQLKSYLLSPSDGYRDNHSFHLGSFYPKGVTCLEYHPSHQVLLMAGRVPTLQSDAGSHNSALELGITAWRFLSDYPHYKLVTSLAEDAQETAYQLSISPSGTIMAAAHTSGAISFWSLPSLLHFRTWQLEELPKFNDLNPQVLEPGRRKHVALRAEATQFSICDMNWWSDEALIVAHHSGAVKVVSLSSKRNLLGESPEWFEFSPQVSGVFDRGFLTLECEWQFAGKKAAVLGPIDDAESSDEEAAPAGLAARAGSIVKHAMYYVTDSQRFAPPRKKPKIITKFYRLLCVKSTTPEELFAAKIDAEEYGEALALARTYGLDSDLVYQRQWRKSTASVAAIQDYLSKITKRTWVLHECLERVPDSLKAARELLEFGLRGTDVEAVATAGESGDEGRFIANSPPFYEDIYGQEHLTEVQHAQKRKDAEQEWRQKWLAKIDFANLTLDQRWLCECRLKLLSYLDRLTMYEIQEELTTSPEKFEASFFERFRSQPPLEAAVWFAQEGDGKAVWTLLTYAGDGVLPHWLTVLSNFPETLAPLKYADCLPEIGTEALTPDLLTQWYSERAHQIEELSSLVENALEITKLGCLKNVEGLEKLYGDLLTLATLVYDCHLTKAVPLARLEEMSDGEKMRLLMSMGLEKLYGDLLTLATLVYDCHLTKAVPLAKLEEMSDGEKMRLLMSMSTKEKFVLCVRDWLLPFVDRCEKAAPGSRRKLLSEFFTEVARDDLGPCVDIFEHSSPDVRSDSFIGHGCESDELKSLQDRLDVQEKHVEVAECMQRYGARVSVKALTDCGEDREQLEQLLNKMALSAVKRSPALSETEWCSFLNDILQFQQSTFKNVGPTSCIKLLRLSEFLRLYGDDAKRREGAVLSLLADAAFQDKDYTHCYEICGKLMAGTHSEGWKICQSLGQCSDFADLSARQKLLAFSLCYCPEPTVEGLLKATQLLELQEIYQRLDLPAEDWFNNGRNTVLFSFKSPEADGKALSPHGSGDSVQSDRGRDHPWDFVGYTAGTTRSVLTTLGSAEFWKGTVRNLTNIKPQKTSEEKVSIARSNHELKRLAVPAFYESLYRDAYLGKYEPSYEQYDLPKWTTVLTDLLNILRASTISDSVNETSPSAENSQVEEVFLNLPSTPVVLGLASYFFSLTALMASQPADVCRLLRRDIADVIEEASRLDTKTVPEKTVRCAELAAKFRRLQADLGQAELLRKQGGSVDVARFAEDDRYKAETILGMAL